MFSPEKWEPLLKNSSQCIINDFKDVSWFSVRVILAAYELFCMIHILILILYSFILVEWSNYWKQVL